MCLIYVAYRVHPRYPLVVAANRDEFHDRASAPAHWWEDAPDVLAGRDLQAGGTWLGLTRGGRFAAVTNFREPGGRRPDARSRGDLVSGFLSSSDDANGYLDGVARRAAQYNGFSLLVHDGCTLAWYSNRGNAPEPVTPGVHGLSNHLLDTPWPKVEEGKVDLLGLLARDALAPEHMLALLADDRPSVDRDLPDSGVGIDRERALSPRFILGDPYGTRCSTLVLLSSSGEVAFRERSFDRHGYPRGDVVFSFRLDAVPGRGASGRVPAPDPQPRSRP